MRRIDLIHLRRPRAAGALAAAAIAAVTLVGCQDQSDGGSEGSSEGGAESATDGDPSEVLQDAVSRTLEQQAFTVDSELSLEIGPQDLRLVIDGSVDYDATIAEVMLGVSQGGIENIATILADGETFWISVEGTQAPPFPDDATWLEGATSRLEESTTFNPGGLLGTVLVLRGADDVEEIGTDEVDDVNVTRYAATFTYDDATDAVSGDEAQVLEDSFTLTGDASALDLEVEVAIGEDGVIREVDFEVVEDDGVPAAGGYDLDLSDVGQEIDVPDAPDPDDVASGPEVESLLDQLVT